MAVFWNGLENSLYAPCSSMGLNWKNCNDIELIIRWFVFRPDDSRKASEPHCAGVNSFDSQSNSCACKLWGEVPPSTEDSTSGRLISMIMARVRCWCFEGVNYGMWLFVWAHTTPQTYLKWVEIATKQIVISIFRIGVELQKSKEVKVKILLKWWHRFNICVKPNRM